MELKDLQNRYQIVKALIIYTVVNNMIRQFKLHIIFNVMCP